MNAPTIIQRLANPRMVGRVTPCAPRLACKRTSFLQPPPSQCFTLKKQIMQVPAFTTCYARSQSAKDAGRIATGFPLPSTGRGIEGEGWSYPEPPPVRFFLYQPHPGSRLNTENSIKNPEISLFYILKPRPTITIAPSPTHGLVGRVTPCAPLLASKPTSYPGCHFPIALLLRNTLCKCLFLQHVTFVAKAPKMPVASPLASLSPQQGEGLRVRGGHIQSCLPSVSSCISTTRRPS